MFNPFSRKKEDTLPPTELATHCALSREFEFSCGKRTWDDDCKHLRGNTAKVVVSYCAPLDQALVRHTTTMFWFEEFVNEHLNNRFILDVNDPWLPQIVNGKPVFKDKVFTCLSATQPLNTKDGREVKIKGVYVPGTAHLAGYELEVDDLSGPEKEFYKSFTFVKFSPTCENLVKWLYECADARLSQINAKVTKVTFYETPSYFAEYSAPTHV